MIHYIVAGSSDNEQSAQLENYCSIVNSTFRNIRVKIILKHPKEWPPYLTEICKIYGFKEKLNPIIFTPEGILVGSAQQFIDLLERKFGVSKLPSENLHMVTKSTNEKLINEDYEIRHRDKLLQEKVDKEFNNHLINGDFNFNREPFKRITCGTHINFVKHSKYLTPKVYIQQEKTVDMAYLERHEPDWDISQAILLDKYPDEPEEDNKKDAQKGKKGDKGEGDKEKNLSSDAKNPTSPNAELQLGSVNKDDVESEMKKAETGGESGDKTARDGGTVNEIQTEGEGEKKEGEEGHKEGEEGVEGEKKEGEEGEEVKEGEEEEEEVEEEDKEFLRVQEIMMNKRPEKRDINGWVVHEWDNDYSLMLNPESLFPRHCILRKNEDLGWFNKTVKNYNVLQANIQDCKKIFKKKTNLRNTFYDFSKVAKIRRADPQFQMFQEQEMAYLEGASNLNSRFIDLKALFTVNDIKMFLKVMSDLDAYLFYGVLPTNYDSFKNYINHNVHIIPRKELLDICNMENGGFNLQQNLKLEKMFEEDIGIISDLNVRLHKEEMERRRLQEEARQNKIARIKKEISDEEKRKAEMLDKKKKKEMWEDGLIDENPDGEPVEETTGKDSKNMTKGKLKDTTKTQTVTTERIQESTKQTEPEVPQQTTEEQPKEEEQPAEEEPIEIQEEAPQEEAEQKYVCPYEDVFYSTNEWNFPHKIYKNEKGQLPEPEKIMDVLEHLATVCELEFGFDIENGGLNLIMGPKFIAFIPYNSHYRDHYNVKLLCEPWNYTGYFTLPDLQKQYPETAVIKDAMKLVEYHEPH